MCYPAADLVMKNHICESHDGEELCEAAKILTGKTSSDIVDDIVLLIGGRRERRQPEIQLRKSCAWLPAEKKISL